MDKQALLGEIEKEAGVALAALTHLKKIALQMEINSPVAVKAAAQTAYREIGQGRAMASRGVKKLKTLVSYQ